MKTLSFSVKTLLVKDAKFLAVYNLSGNKKIWDLPGGRMEFGETAEETLKREILEELNIEIEPIKVIDTWNYWPNENTQITGLIYFSIMKTNKILISDEHDGYAWIDFKKVSEYFTKDFLLDKMQSWEWASIIDNKIKFTK